MSKNLDISPEWAAAGQTHLSPSSLTITPAMYNFKYLYLKERRREIVVGERAALGTSVHNAAQNIVCKGADIEGEITQAQLDYDFHDANEDQVLRDKLRECIDPMVRNAVDLLLEAGFAGAVPEEKISTRLADVNIPVIGFVDLLVPGTMFVEMKTKGPRKTKLLKSGEQGWSKASLPKSVEYNHLIQCAIYQHALQVTPAVMYIAEHEAVLYTPFNCDDLKADRLADALEDARQRALIRQNLLKVSNDPKVLAKIIDPDWKHMYQWKMQPEILREARELWKQ